jgi:membrane-associated protease RseP (regulator of RpoE activity)
MHSPFVREHDLGTRYAAGPDMVVGWGVGGPTRGRPARLGTLMLGDVPIRDLADDLYTGDKDSFANPDLAGNLGSGALRRFTVTFDYDAKRMYLVPNAEAGKPDGFDRSGMWLFQDGDAMKIVALVPGGPAAKAGLVEGDRIVKIGAERAAARKLADWRARLRDTAAGTRVPVTVARGGKEETIGIVLADLIPPHAAH